MKILSHRGYWKTPEEKNSPTAFVRSFHLGFGTETDFRDLSGKLVISHDTPTSEALSAQAFLEMYQGVGRDLPLALNIKADGLQKLLAPMLERFALQSAFVFDMSVPDMLGWLKVGVPVFTRQSEYETSPVLYKQSAGVWLDGFEGQWWDAALIQKHLDAGKSVCLVSPDLHGRDPRSAWDSLALPNLIAHPGFLICTDRPEDASSRFHA